MLYLSMCKCKYTHLYTRTHVNNYIYKYVYLLQIYTRVCIYLFALKIINK